jgi:hypothetical protein
MEMCLLIHSSVFVSLVIFPYCDVLSLLSSRLCVRFSVVGLGQQKFTQLAPGGLGRLSTTSPFTVALVPMTEAAFVS